MYEEQVRNFRRSRRRGTAMEKVKVVTTTYTNPRTTATTMITTIYRTAENKGNNSKIKDKKKYVKSKNKKGNIRHYECTGGN